MKQRKSRFDIQYSYSKLIYRIIWVYFGKILFSLMPNKFFNIKNLILKLFGANIGRGSRIYSSAYIHFPFNFNIGENSLIGSDVEIKNHSVIYIGDNCTISQRTSIIDSSHDFKLDNFPLYSKPITIKNNIWIAQECFIGPGVNLDSNVIIGARGVCFKNLAKGVYIGNPIRKIK